MSKTNRKSHQSGLQFERLEDRLPLAGDVLLSEKISTVGGVQVKDLTLTGDAQANDISIIKQENGNWLIEGNADTTISIKVNKVNVPAPSRIVEVPAGGIRKLSIDLKAAQPIPKGSLLADAVSLAGDVNGQSLVVGGDLKIVGKHGGVVDLDHVEARGTTTITFGNGISSAPIGSVVTIADSVLGVNSQTGKKGKTTITTGINDDRVLITDTQFGGDVSISLKDGDNNAAMLGRRSDDSSGFASSTTVNGNLSLTASSGQDRLGVLGLVVKGNLTLATGKGNDFSGAADMAVLGTTSVTSTDGDDVAAIGLRDANGNPLPPNGFGNVMRGAVTVNLGNGNDIAAAHRTTFGGVVNGKLLPAKITVTLGAGDDKVAESENTFNGNSSNPFLDAFNAIKGSRGGAGFDTLLSELEPTPQQLFYLGFESSNLGALDGILNAIFNDVNAGFHDILLAYGIDIGGGGGGGDDHGNTIATATDLGTLPTFITGVIGSPTDVDMFSFSVEAGQILEFTLSPDGIFNPVLRLFRANGQILAPLVNAGGAGDPEHFFFVFDDAGTYFAGVSGVGNSTYNANTGAAVNSGDTGSYSLEVGSIPADDDDAIDEVLPTLTVDGGATSGDIDNVFDVDLYQLDLAAGQKVSIHLEPDFSPDLQLVLRVFDAGGNVLHTVVAFSGGLAVDDLLLDVDAEGFPAGGTFFVGVSSFGNDAYFADGTGDIEGDFTGSYLLGVTQVVPEDLDDQVSEAIDLGAAAANPQFAGSIENATDVDMYSFTAVAGQTVTITVTPDNVDFDAVLILFGGAPLVAIDSDVSPTTGSPATVVFNVTEDGTYYVGVSSFPNTGYDPETGDGDFQGDLLGAYTLTLTV